MESNMEDKKLKINIGRWSLVDGRLSTFNSQLDDFSKL